jgi:hypothetical protein
LCRERKKNTKKNTKKKILTPEEQRMPFAGADVDGVGEEEERWSKVAVLIQCVSLGAGGP